MFVRLSLLIDIVDNHEYNTHLVDTESQIEELEKRFKDIQIAARKELEKKEDAVDLVKDELTAMPRKEHEKVISAIARRTKPFKNLAEFFIYLTTRCWNFFEYQPLMQLVLNTCSVTLKQEVKRYRSDVQEFLQRTTISEFIKYRRHLARKG